MRGKYLEKRRSLQRRRKCLAATLGELVNQAGKITSQRELETAKFVLLNHVGDKVSSSNALERATQHSSRDQKEFGNKLRGYGSTRVLV